MASFYSKGKETQLSDERVGRDFMVTVQPTLRKHSILAIRVFSCNELDYLDCFPVPNTVSDYYRDLEKTI